MRVLTPSNRGSSLLRLRLGEVGRMRTERIIVSRMLHLWGLW
jgi:hypothetical protein